ncbi:MAG: DUF1667 domain-containing protein [Thermoplasmata archaeon]|nr:DUF1667 domain-containing protein [Thermoplasmata archaeon]
MNKELICIVCPIGCNLNVEYSETSIESIEGNLCQKGVEYVEKEIFHPERTLTTSVLVLHGKMPLASVRTTGPIPKAIIKKVMAEIKKIKLEAPVKFGQVIVKDVEGTGVDVVVTREVKRRGRG